MDVVTAPAALGNLGGLSELNGVAPLKGPTGPATWPDAPLPDGVPRCVPGDLCRDGARAVLVVPQLIDGLRAVGGLLALLSRQGRPLVLVAATDDTLGLQSRDAWMAARRARSQAAGLADACRVLGLSTRMERRLPVPAGQAGAQGARVEQALRRLLQPGDLVLTPWRHDGPPDHEAVARAAAAACAGVRGATQVEVPLHMWQWSGPGDARVPWSTLASVVLPPAVQQRKAQALRGPGGDHAGWLGPREFFFLSATPAALQAA